MAAALLIECRGQDEAALQVRGASVSFVSYRVVTFRPGGEARCHCDARQQCPGVRAQRNAAYQRLLLGQ